MKSRVLEAPVNAISGSAQATGQLSYAVRTDIDAIFPDLRRILDQLGFEDVIISENNQISFQAMRQDANNMWVKRVVKSLKKSVYRLIHILPNLLDSLLNEYFHKRLT